MGTDASEHFELDYRTDQLAERWQAYLPFLAGYASLHGPIDPPSVDASGRPLWAPIHDALTTLTRRTVTVATLDRVVAADPDDAGFAGLLTAAEARLAAALCAFGAAVAELDDSLAATHYQEPAATARALARVRARAALATTHHHHGRRPDPVVSPPAAPARLQVDDLADMFLADAIVEGSEPAPAATPTPDTPPAGTTTGDVPTAHPRRRRRRRIARTVTSSSPDPETAVSATSTPPATVEPAADTSASNRIRRARTDHPVRRDASRPATVPRPSPAVTTGRSSRRWLRGVTGRVWRYLRRRRAVTQALVAAVTVAGVAQLTVTVLRAVHGPAGPVGRAAALLWAIAGGTAAARIWLTWKHVTGHHRPERKPTGPVRPNDDITTRLHAGARTIVPPGGVGYQPGDVVIVDGGGVPQFVVAVGTDELHCLPTTTTPSPTANVVAVGTATWEPERRTAFVDIARITRYPAARVGRKLAQLGPAAVDATRAATAAGS